MLSNNQPIKLSFAGAWRTYLGGAMLREFLGETNAQDDHFPEEWIMSVVSARNPGREDVKDEGLSKLASSSEISLKSVIEKDPLYYLGKDFVKKNGEGLGVLIKLIDSYERLSVQVHPNRTKAQELFHSAYGKTECWHILGGREVLGEVPSIYLGFKPGITREEWKHLFDIQDIPGMLNCMHKFPVKKGETVIINGGVPHAIGAGCFLTEIQEPTDYTIRIERTTESGLKIDDRMCHQGLGFDKMFDCFAYDGLTEEETRERWFVPQKKVQDTPEYTYTSLIDGSTTKMFSLYDIEVKKGSFALPLPQYFSGIYVMSGEGVMECNGEEYSLSAGDEFFIPAGCAEVKFTSESSLKAFHFYGPSVE